MASERNTTSIEPSTFRTHMSNAGPTVITAWSKLKQEQGRLLREHKRYRVLNHQISKQDMTQLNKSRQQMFLASVKQSADHDREVKRQLQRKKIEEIKLRYSINLKNREKNKKMMENIKRSFHNANHEVYEQIRQKKREEQEGVKMRRSFYLQSRVLNRKKSQEQKDKRRKSIQHFYQTKVETYKRKKEDEVKELLKQSQERRRFCEALSSRNSRIKEVRMSNSRSLSNRSMDNPERLTLQADLK